MRLNLISLLIHNRQMVIAKIVHFVLFFEYKNNLYYYKVF